MNPLIDMEAAIFLTSTVFLIWVFKFISIKIERLEKENRELKLSNRELLDANYKLIKK